MSVQVSRRPIDTSNTADYQHATHRWRVAWLISGRRRL